MKYTWKFFYNQETQPNTDVSDIAMNYTSGRKLGSGSTKWRKIQKLRRCARKNISR
jgi:hypothetical protein